MDFSDCVNLLEGLKHFKIQCFPLEVMCSLNMTNDYNMVFLKLLILSLTKTFW